MANIDKTTIPISKAAAAMVVVAGFIAQYYTTQSAVKDGFNEFKRETDVKFKEFEGRQNLTNSNLNSLEKRIDGIELGITSYIGKAIIPESPRIQGKRR